MVDNVRTAKFLPIHTGNEKHGFNLGFIDSPGNIATDAQSHGPARLAANSSDIRMDRMLEQVPLHEGRRKSVLRSGAERVLASAELDGMLCPIARYRESPGDRP